MTLGTDASIEVCETEGYLMMLFEQDELMPNGVLNPACSVRFIAHLPMCAKEEITIDEGEIKDFTLVTDVLYDANELWHLYNESKDSIDNFIGGTHTFPITPSDLLCLASDINSYRSI